MIRLETYILRQMAMVGVVFFEPLAALELQPDLFVSLEDARSVFDDRDAIERTIEGMQELRLYEARAVDGSEQILVCVRRKLKIESPFFWTSLLQFMKAQETGQSTGLLN